VNISNLNQFNPPKFFKLLGHYIKRRRTDLNLSLDDLSFKVKTLTSTQLSQIESGSLPISDEEFYLLDQYLFLEPEELLNIAKITQVQKIMEINREINDLFPK